MAVRLICSWEIAKLVIEITPWYSSCSVSALPMFVIPCSFAHAFCCPPKPNSPGYRQDIRFWLYPNLCPFVIASGTTKSTFCVCHDQGRPERPIDTWTPNLTARSAFLQLQMDVSLQKSNSTPSRSITRTQKLTPLSPKTIENPPASPGWQPSSRYLGVTYQNACCLIATTQVYQNQTATTSLAQHTAVVTII